MLRVTQNVTGLVLSRPSHAPYVNEGPLVQVLHDAGQTRQNAFRNASQPRCITIGLCGICQHAKRLDNGNNQRSEANATEGRGDGTEKGIVNGRAPEAAFIRVVPPRANRTSCNDVNRILKRFKAKIEVRGCFPRCIESAQVDYVQLT